MSMDSLLRWAHRAMGMSVAVLPEDWRVDGADPVELDERTVAVLIDRVTALDEAIGSGLRQSNQAMALAVGVAALAAGIGGDASPGTLRLLWFVVPAMLTVAALYNLNTAADVAGLAELRDRLGYRVDRALGHTTYLARDVANTRRTSTATVAAYVVVGVILAAAYLGGIGAASQDALPWVLPTQIALTVVMLAALLVAMVEFSQARRLVNEALDRIFGEGFRPGDAPGGVAER